MSRHGQHRQVPRVCELASCRKPFHADAYKVEHGRGRFCSISCAVRSRPPFPIRYGADNPAWRGGRSRDHMYYKARFRAKFPEKALAHDLVAGAVRRGEIVRPDACQACHAQGRPQAHHDDYKRPLKVRWLCRPCHRIADRMRHERETLRQAAQRLFRKQRSTQQARMDINGTKERHA